MIVSGATGGHLFPALSLGIELKNHYSCEIIVIINAKSAHLKENLDSYDFTFLEMDAITNKYNPIQILKTLWKAFRFIKYYRPDAIVGFGSSITFPVILAGWFRKVPCMLHEQNAAFGIANNYARHLCDLVALTFPIDSVKKNAKYIHTGNILRPEIDLYLRATKPYSQRRLDPVRLLVCGGSQGSQTINQTIVSALQLMSSEERKKIVLYHLIGPHESEETYKNQYTDLGMESHVWQFLSDMGRVYSIIDLVISRAGAGTISELIAFGIPSILIPYPYAHAHQLLNAQYLADRGGAVILEETELRPELLKREIVQMSNDKDKCYRMSEAIKKTSTEQSTQLIANNVLTLTKKKR